MISVSLSVAQGFIASRSSWRTGESFSSLCWSLCRRGDFAEIQQKEMALVLMCGQPCSGKSTAAACLKEALEKRSNVPVILIDEPSLNLDRNESYQGVWAEVKVEICTSFLAIRACLFLAVLDPETFYCVRFRRHATGEEFAWTTSVCCGPSCV